MDIFKKKVIKKLFGPGGYYCRCCQPVGYWSSNQSWKHHVRRYTRHIMKQDLYKEINNE